MPALLPTDVPCWYAWGVPSCFLVAATSLDGYLLPSTDPGTTALVLAPGAGVVLLGARAWGAVLRRDRITDADAWERARGRVPHVVVGEHPVWLPPGAPVRRVTGPPEEWWEQVVGLAGDGEVRVLAGDAATTALVLAGHVRRTRVRVEPVLLGSGAPLLPSPDRLALELDRVRSEDGAVVLEHRVTSTGRVPAHLPGSVADFVLARLAEDEEVARAATGPRWVPAVDRAAGAGWTDVTGWLATLPNDGYSDRPGATVATLGEAADQRHVVRWDPARVLAECAARRRLVTACADLPEVLAELALVWVDHPDHDPGWRPAG
ncbi:DUF6221 family protein [Auraticoccus monumenti]|uniref:Dihydrofolate reductase n=1 Tax=Auraticoccus monumenti TaxID=675864 RepID=A0A1G7DH84_9ACTN|nr:DUF6221 family protein [Auraticoccus monumenti]SDE50426.1 Dihydrofolate reductase [Auraticoccus monumenti]